MCLLGFYCDALGSCRYVYVSSIVNISYISLDEFDAKSINGTLCYRDVVIVWGGGDFLTYASDLWTVDGGLNLVYFGLWFIWGSGTIFGGLVERD